MPVLAACALASADAFPAERNWEPASWGKWKGRRTWKRLEGLGLGDLFGEGKWMKPLYWAVYCSGLSLDTCNSQENWVELEPLFLICLDPRG